MNQLNNRQWRLYELLKHIGDRWMSQQEIYQNMSDLYPVPGADFHGTTGRIITKDIQALKESDIADKVILSSSKGNKIATKEEYAEALERKEMALLKQVRRHFKQKKKAAQDGQMRLRFNSEKEYYQAFVDKAVE